MTSNRAKGVAYEREVEKALNDAGWLTSRAPGSTKFSKKVDLLGIFDIVAVHPKTAEPIWVQVTTETAASDRRRKMEEVIKEYPIVHNIRLYGYLAIRYKGGRWRWQAMDERYKWEEQRDMWIKKLGLKMKEIK